jgi:hypothetical protein
MTENDLSRQSPNVLRLGDVIEAIADDGQPFIGKIVKFYGGGSMVALNNGYATHLMRLGMVVRPVGGVPTE